MATARRRDLVRDIRIEPMTRRHLRQVIRIEQDVYPRPWSLALFLSELALPRTRSYFVARDASQVAGYGGLMMTGEDAHVTTLAVDPIRQSRGIGTALLLRLVDEAIVRGAKGITLEVRTNNTVAIKIYERFGFEQVGVRKNYYVETGEDALIMWVRNVDSSDFEERIASIRSTVIPTEGPHWGPRR